MQKKSVDRPLEIAAFLDEHGWADASFEPVPADFSPRRYARLKKISGETAILMDADCDQKTPQFVGIANMLLGVNIRAPHIYGAAPDRGLVVMEDFGSRNVGKLIEQGEDPHRFFAAASTLLAHLHQHFDRMSALNLDLPLFNAQLFTSQAELFLDVYFRFSKQREASDSERADFRAAWKAVLRPVEIMPKSLLLRDFMPYNLMDLEDGQLGILDFQDGGIGCIAYDLASMCDVVRWPGAFALLPGIVRHYLAKTTSTDWSMSEADLTRACTILGAQRHTRHLGNVMRAGHRPGQSKKLEFLPRIEEALKLMLDEPFLQPVKEWMTSVEIAL